MNWARASLSPDRQNYRHLAIRVISLALRDLIVPGGSPADRASARAFLAGSRMLSHWCAVAELDPARLVMRATEWQDTSQAENRPVPFDLH